MRREFPKNFNPQKETCMREFSTGAARGTDKNKPDYEGYLSPIVLERFSRYMMKHQRQVDGKLRDSDNWQKGIPLDAYMKSMWRHFMDVWFLHRFKAEEGNLNYAQKEALCALMFNVMGYLHELLKTEQPSKNKINWKAFE